LELEYLLIQATKTKLEQYVILMLFLVVPADTQLPLLFRLAQLIHHQESQLAQHLVDLIVVGGLVKFHLELVDNNTGQEHVPGQTAPHTLKRIPEFAVIRFVALGALGKV
jgi:hypothetical protein